MLKLALGNPITGVPRAREAAAQTHSCGARAEAAAQTHSGGISNTKASAEMLKLAPPQSDHGSAACAGGCSTNPQLRRNLECGERRCGDGPPQSDRGSAATEMLNPHAREAAAQTHICGGISTA